MDKIEIDDCINDETKKIACKLMPATGIRVGGRIGNETYSDKDRLLRMEKILPREIARVSVRVKVMEEKISQLIESIPAIADSSESLKSHMKVIIENDEKEWNKIRRMLKKHNAGLHNLRNDYRWWRKQFWKLAILIVGLIGGYVANSGLW